MREKCEFLLQWKELFKDPSLDADKNSRFRAIQHVVSLHHLDLADMLHQYAIETMAACLCRLPGWRSDADEGEDAEDFAQ